MRKLSTLTYLLSLLILLLVRLEARSQTTIVNYDFNIGTTYSTLTPALASGITSTCSSTETFSTVAGTTTGASAFTANTTAGNAITMSNSSGTNTRYFQFQLGGTSLSQYQSYKIYIQSQRSSTGASVITLAYSTDGVSYTNFSSTGAPGNGSFSQIIFDVSSIAELNNVSTVYFRLLASGASSTGTLRIDNFQVQGTQSNTPVTPATPITSSISPSSANAGDPAFTLTVNGSNFVNGSTVTWGGTNKTTSFVSANQLTAAISASDISTAGTANVGVTTVGATPSASNTQTFTINPAVAATPTKLSIISISPATPVAGSVFSVTVQSQDGLGASANVTAATDITLSLNSGTGSLGGTPTGTIANGTSSTTISGVTYNTAESGVKITGTATSGMTGLTAGTSTSFTVVSAAPATPASSLIFGLQTTTSIPINSWVSGNGSNRIIVARLSATPAVAPSAGVVYSVNSSSFTDVANGSTGTGNKVIYNGNGSGPLTVTGLTAGTQYSFDIYEYNGSGATTNYGTAYSASHYTLTNEPVAHSSTFAASGISSFGFNLNFSPTTTTTGYIILQKVGNTAPTGVPIDTTAYTLGSTLGDGTVAAFITSSGTSSTIVNGLSSSTKYSFAIIPFGRNGTNNQTYNYYTGGSIPTLTVTTAVDNFSLNTVGTALTENFDGMGNSATAPLPIGFKIGTNWSTGSTATSAAAGTNGTGALTSSSSGGTYNFGSGVTASSTDRSLGLLFTSGFTTPRSIILKLTNHTGSMVSALTISFDYEKYRSGTNTFNWTFFHGNTITPTTSATGGDQAYAADAAVAVIDPLTSINKSFTLTGLSIPNGSDYYFKWTLSAPASSNAQALGIDNLSITVPYSSDAALSNLVLSSGAITPSFDSATTAYTSSVANNINAVTITPTASNVNSKITINGNVVITGTASASIPLNVGDNIISTNVTAQNAITTKTYTVIVTRKEPGVPTLKLTAALPDFENVCINNNIVNPFTIDGSNLDGTNISIAALAGFSYSETANGTFSNTLNFAADNNFSGKVIYVKFNPILAQSYNGNIRLNGGGVVAFDVLAAGSGVVPIISNESSSAIAATTAILSASIDNAACINGEYGFVYSSDAGFPDGSGTNVPSSNLTSGIFSVNVTGLTPNARIYYKAFVTSNSGTSYGSQQSFINTPLPVTMAAQNNLSFTETFADISNWSNFFISGSGANHFGGLSANASASALIGIPNGVSITSSTNSFQGAAFGASAGVQKGTDQAPATQSIVLLSTSSPDNTTSAAIDFYVDFTGVNAGTLSFDWASINNSTGDRKGSLRIYGSTDGTSFIEIPSAAVLNFTNNNATSGSISNIALPASFNNNPNARLRFYYYNGTGGSTGSRPKISIDNLTVTAVPSTPCSTPTAQPSSMVFGTKTDVSIQGSFSAASPAADQYITIASTNNSLTSTLIDGTTYNVGDAFGDGTVVAKGSSLNFTATGLSPATTYYFFTFAVNAVCTGGPKYLTTSPLINSATTNSALPSCTAPASQPINLNFVTTSVTTIQGSFNAVSADEYLVLISRSSSLTNDPVNGQLYNAGDVIGNATVVQRNAGTSFTANGLSADTKYYFYIYSLNSQNCVNGPTYNLTSPLNGSQSTQPLPPCAVPSSQATLLSLQAANTSVSGTFNGTASADNYLIIRSTSAALTATPENNTDYVVGTSLGGGVVIANGSSTSFLSTNLSAATTYYFFVFAENKNCSGGTKYLTASPLTGNINTTHAIVNNYYFGTLHSHSDYSDGNQDHPGYTPTDDYNFAMTANCMDFLGISEHNHFSSPDNPGNTITNFHKGSVEANNFTAAHPGFLALYGMEWGVISGGGHVVVYGDGMDKLFGWESGNGGWGPTDNYDVYVPKSVYTGSTGLFKNVNDYKDQNTFATLAHPNQTDFNNLAGIPYDAVADSAIVGSAVESGPATTTNTTYSSPGSSMSYLWYYQTLLSKGYHLGPTIDHDNHNTTFGHATYSRTAVIAPALTKTDLIKAIRDMHFYATQDCDSKVDFTINTKIMGSAFSDRNAPAISVTLSDLTTNTSSAIIRVMYGKPGSGVLPVKIDSVIGNNLSFVDNDLANGETGYYYIDITNGTSRIVTSPIWYTRTCSIATDTTVYACGSYTWNGQTYDASGTYTKAGFKSVEGCDSTANLHLTITSPTTGDTTVVTCDSFTWYGITYTESGTPTHVLKERGGCDSVITIHLTITHSTTTDESVTACDTYIWHGSTYTTSGDYTYVSQNEQGCTNTATLHLTINHSTTTTETVLTCDAYEWHGITYTTSGTYIYTSPNAANCINTATLHLKVNHSTTSSETQVACDSYTWNGTTYTKSGDYTYQSLNEQGCTNAATLHLTINKNAGMSVTASGTTAFCPGGSVDLTATSAVTYLWNNAATSKSITVNQSGNYSVTVTDANGCSATSQPTTITVEDVTPPIVHTQNINVVLGADGTVAITPSQINNGSTDNCSINENGYALDKTKFDCANVGENMVTLTVTDVSGNHSSATATVMVTDNENPTITAPANVSVNADKGSCSATNVSLGTPATNDNCGVASVTNDAPSSYPVGQTTVTWTVTDIHGNTATATQTVTVTDNQAPVISTNGNKIVTVDAGQCGAAVVISATVADNCGVGSPVATRSDNLALSAQYPVGLTTITWTVIDIHGNTATATQTITVTDDQKPTITCKGNQTRTVNNANCTYKVAGNEFDPTAFSDNCPGATIKNSYNNSNTLANAVFPKGNTIVTWTVTDAHQNSTTCTTTITINSTLAIAIPDVYAVKPGGAANTIYIGYGPSSVTLSASVSGGTAPYSYKWTIGSPAGAALSTNASYNVNPTATTTYVLNVKDVYGCTVAYVTKTINVVDVRCGSKVTVCVYQKGKYTTTCVTSGSVSGYLSSGSYLGSCSTPAPLYTSSSARSTTDVSIEPKLLKPASSTFEVKVAPNPTTTNFKIQVNSSSNQVITIRILDEVGRVITTLNNIQNNAVTTFGNTYRGGTYFAEVIQGINRKTVKLVKLN